MTRWSDLAFWVIVFILCFFLYLLITDFAAKSTPQTTDKPCNSITTYKWVNMTLISTQVIKCYKCEIEAPEEHKSQRK